MNLAVKVPRPPFPGLGRQMESQLRKALYKFELVDGVQRLALALSGGKDSLTMLFLLHAVAGRGFPDFTIHPIHVTGEFSCGAGVEVPYLQAICDELGLELTVCESHQTLDTLECYGCSRERRKLLFDAAKKLDATTIAFGHHRDDNAQTCLMNLLQKGEFKAILPKLEMRKYGVTLIRPLLYISEEQIKRFAQQQGFARVMCRCPVGQNSMRKKVDQLLEEIEELYPHARRNISQGALLYGSKKATKT